MIDSSILGKLQASDILKSYEPYNFKGQLDDFPLTMDYGMRMDALRTALRGYFRDGEYRDTIGVTVITEDDSPHHSCAVFVSKTGGAPGRRNTDSSAIGGGSHLGHVASRTPQNSMPARARIPLS